MTRTSSSAALSFLSVAVMLTACAGTQSSSRPDSPGAGGRVPFVYVAGYRPEITIFRLDTATGTLHPVGQTPAGTAPSFLATDPASKFLYAVDEVDVGKVLAFSINQKTGGLTHLNDVSSAGIGPAHLSVDKTGHWVLVANYADDKPGTIGILPVRADGSLGEPADTRDYGPGTMPHQIFTDASNRFLFVPCKGGNFVAQLAFDPATGKLTPNEPERLPTAPKAGPRHLALHPSGKFAYLINEVNLTMTAYSYDGEKGRLTELQTLPTLFPGAKVEGSDNAEVEVHSSGKFLYGSTRGASSIVIYKLDDAGRMTLVGHELRTIKTPRHFQIDPTGTLLLVANQDSDSVSIFRIDQATGKLDLVSTTPVGKQPSYVGVVMLPGA